MKSKKKIDIEKYIQDYENGVLSKEEIAKLVGSTRYTIEYHMNAYYSEKR